MESIFKDTITANKRWGIDQLSESEKFDVAFEQLERAIIEIGEAKAALKHYQNGNAELPEVIEELADVAIFMQSCAFALSSAPLDEMIKQKSAKVLERKGVMLGGSFVKEKDLNEIFGTYKHWSMKSGHLHGFNCEDQPTKGEYRIVPDVAAKVVRNWMESREL